MLTGDEIRSRLFLRSDGYLWLVCDASSGERSEVRDVSCPMKTVDYVFDSENVSIIVKTSGLPNCTDVDNTFWSSLNLENS